MIFLVLKNTMLNLIMIIQLKTSQKKRENQYFENIEEFFEHLEMKLQMTFQQKMTLRKLIELLDFFIERLCLPKYKDLSIIKKVSNTIKLYGVELIK
jgi:hypothetical protein